MPMFQIKVIQGGSSSRQVSKGRTEPDKSSRGAFEFEGAGGFGVTFFGLDDFNEGGKSGGREGRKGREEKKMSFFLNDFPDAKTSRISTPPPLQSPLTSYSFAQSRPHCTHLPLE